MRFLFNAVFALSFFITSQSQAADLTDAKVIVEKANHVAFYQANDGKALARMLIIDNQGRKQFRQFSIARKDLSDNDKDQMFFVDFKRPADVKKTTFLVHKRIDSEDDRWLYLPSLDLVKRISAGDKRTSFVGSHFYYEDVSGRQLKEDSHTLSETTNKFYIISAQPKAPETVEFTSYKVWIDKHNFMPVKTEYYNERGEIYRKVEALEIEDIAGFPTATKMRIDDLNADGYTLMELKNVEYNIGLSDSEFSERSLRNPPSSLTQ